MKYEVYYRKITDGRAPEHVNLGNEYTKGSTLQADHRREAERKLLKLAERESKMAGADRGIRVGDVLIEYGPVKQSIIYTVTGSWALVKLVTV
jgi:hypothetical protein